MAKNDALMIRLKHKLLPWYAQYLERRNKFKRYNVGFLHAESIGILYDYAAIQSSKNILAWKDFLQKSGKKTKVLCYLTGENKNFDFKFPVVTNQDIQWSGKISDVYTKAFIKTPFDYLYVITTQYHPVIHYLLAKSQAKCRIGKRLAIQSNCLDVLVDFTAPNTPNTLDTADKLIQQIWHYSTKL